MGATPELRDGLFENGFNSYLIDVNLEMILAMTELLKNENSQEVMVKANWLNNPLQDHYFDVILGDAVLPNLPWDKRTQFYHEIKRLLRPGGYFINRAFVIPNQKPYKTIEEVLTSFSNKKASNETAIELVFEIQILTHDSADHLGSMEKVARVVEKLREENGFHLESRELNQTLGIIWDYWLKVAGKKVWLYPYQKEEEAEYRKYFQIEENFSAKDHPYGHITPMYLLKA